MKASVEGRKIRAAKLQKAAGDVKMNVERAVAQVGAFSSLSSGSGSATDETRA